MVVDKADVESSSSSRGTFDNRATHPRGNYVNNRNGEFAEFNNKENLFFLMKNFNFKVIKYFSMAKMQR